MLLHAMLRHAMPNFDKAVSREFHPDQITENVKQIVGKSLTFDRAVGKPSQRPTPFL